jgi:hypothetical protein
MSEKSKYEAPAITSYSFDECQKMKVELGEANALIDRILDIATSDLSRSKTRILAAIAEWKSQKRT